MIRLKKMALVLATAYAVSGSNLALADDDHHPATTTLPFTGTVVSIKRTEERLGPEAVVPPVIRALVLKIDPTGTWVKPLHGKTYLTRDALGRIELRNSFKLLDGDLIQLTPHSELAMERAGQRAVLKASSDSSWYKIGE
jgi:hypothetical protein